MTEGALVRSALMRWARWLPFYFKLGIRFSRMYAPVPVNDTAVICEHGCTHTFPGPSSRKSRNRDSPVCHGSIVLRFPATGLEAHVQRAPWMFIMKSALNILTVPLGTVTIAPLKSTRPCGSVPGPHRRASIAGAGRGRLAESAARSHFARFGHAPGRGSRAAGPSRPCQVTRAPARPPGP